MNIISAVTADLGMLKLVYVNKLYVQTNLQHLLPVELLESFKTSFAF